MKLYVHIDRLVLDRVHNQPLNREQLAEAIQAGFASRIAAGGLPLQLRSSSMRSDAANPRNRPDAGDSIGRALYGSLNQ